MTTTLGPYVTGERPDSLLHTFLDFTGEPIDLTDFTATAVMRTATGISTALTCSIPTPTDGVVRVDLPLLDVPGTTRLEVKAGSAGPIYMSERFRFYVRAALPTAEV